MCTFAGTYGFIKLYVNIWPTIKYRNVIPQIQQCLADMGYVGEPEFWDGHDIATRERRFIFVSPMGSIKEFINSGFPTDSGEKRLGYIQILPDINGFQNEKHRPEISSLISARFYLNASFPRTLEQYQKSYFSGRDFDPVDNVRIRNLDGEYDAYIGHDFQGDENGFFLATKKRRKTSSLIDCNNRSKACRIITYAEEGLMITYRILISDLSKFESINSFARSYVNCTLRPR